MMPLLDRIQESLQRSNCSISGLDRYFSTRIANRSTINVYFHLLIVHHGLDKELITYLIPDGHDEEWMDYFEEYFIPALRRLQHVA